MFDKIRKALRTFQFEKRIEATNELYDLKIMAAATADEAFDHRGKRKEQIYATNSPTRITTAKMVSRIKATRSQLKRFRAVFRAMPMPAS